MGRTDASLMEKNRADIQDKAIAVFAADLRAERRWIIGILIVMALLLIAILVLLVVISLQLGG